MFDFGKILRENGNNKLSGTIQVFRFCLFNGDTNVLGILQNILLLYYYICTIKFLIIEYEESLDKLLLYLQEGKYFEVYFFSIVEDLEIHN